MRKLIIICLLVVFLMVFLGTYEGINLTYYQENTADNWVNIGFIPFLIYLLIALFLDRYNHSIKDNKLFDALKYSLGGVTGLGLFCYLILTPVFSGAVILTNDLFCTQEPRIIKGKVVNKSSIEGPKLSEYEITVQIDSKLITWDTNGVEIKKYEIGDNFNEEMSQGIWGLWTKDN